MSTNIGYCVGVGPKIKVFYIFCLEMHDLPTLLLYCILKKKKLHTYTVHINFYIFQFPCGHFSNHPKDGHRETQNNLDLIKLRVTANCVISYYIYISGKKENKK